MNHLLFQLDSYLSLDGINLCCQPLDHAVQVGNLCLGGSQVVSVSASRCLYLLKLNLKKKIAKISFSNLNSLDNN